MTVQILNGDCRDVLKTLSDESVNCVVTSPPYFGLRDYGVDGQIGLEPTPEAFVAEMVDVFREVRRVLRKDGTVWLNLGDSYAGSWGAQSRSGQMSDRSIVSARQIAGAAQKKPRTGSIPEGTGLKPKDLIGIPWRVAFALQDDGWYLRQDIIWHKPNPMPESVTDRCTKAHEYIFLLTKSPKYFYDAAAIAEPLERPEEANRKTPAVFGGRDKHTEAKKQSRLHSGNEYVGTDSGTRNKRTVWSVASQAFKDAHFATFPPSLIEPCVKAGCPAGGTVLDPFGGAGTTGLVADRLQRNAILIELNPEYAAMAERRIFNDAPLFAGDAA